MSEAESTLVCLRQSRHSCSLPRAPGRAERAGSGDALGMCLQGHRVPHFVLHLSSCGARGGLGFAWSRKGLFLLESQIPPVPGDAIFHQHVGWTCQVKHQRGKLPFPSPGPFPKTQLNQTLSSAHSFSHPRRQTCPAPCTGGSCSQKTQPSLQGCCSSWAWWHEVGSSHSAATGLVAFGAQVPSCEKFQHLGLIS